MGHTRPAPPAGRAPALVLRPKAGAGLGSPCTEVGESQTQAAARDNSTTCPHHSAETTGRPQPRRLLADL